jgi:hypothetical protein
MITDPMINVARDNMSALLLFVGLFFFCAAALAIILKVESGWAKDAWASAGGALAGGQVSAPATVLLR